MKNRVLIIEDQEGIALALQEYLTDNGLVVRVATTGKQALSELDANRFDVLVTDFRLPDMDGLTVVRHGVKRLPNLQSIFVTGFKNQLRGATLQEVSKFEVLEKPCRPRDILRAIQRLL